MRDGHAVDQNGAERVSNRQPVLNGMFTQLPEPAAVNVVRDAAMQQVSQAEERQQPGFTDVAGAFVLDYLTTHGPTSGEQLTVACKAAGHVPHDDRAFGPIYFGLVKRGLIEKAGICKRLKGHGTSGGNIWRKR